MAVAIFQCEDCAVPDFEVRPVRPQDAREMAELLAAVAEERDGIATEPPVDVDARTHEFAASAAGSLVAETDGARSTLARAASESASSQCSSSAGGADVASGRPS